jgi:hypothetical protein
MDQIETILNAEYFNFFLTADRFYHYWDQKFDGISRIGF